MILDNFRDQIELFKAKVKLYQAHNIMNNAPPPPPPRQKSTISQWVIDQIMHDTFTKVPLNFEIHEQGGMICMVPAEIVIDGNKLVCNNKPVQFPWRAGYKPPVDVRLCDNAGAVCITMHTQLANLEHADLLTVTFDKALFTIT
jgi:hypothetical protein